MTDLTPDEMSQIAAKVLRVHTQEDPFYEFWINVGTMLMVAAVNEDEPILWTHAQAIATSLRDAATPRPDDDHPNCNCEWVNGTRIFYPDCPVHGRGKH